MTVRKLAAQYVRDQLQVMKKYGSAPRLTPEKRRELIASVERTFLKHQRAYAK
jgi:hypothetical protein